MLRGIVALIMIKMPIQSVFPLSEYNTGNTVAVAATRTAYDIGATHTRRTVFNNNTKITALSLAASVAAVEVVACMILYQYFVVGLSIFQVSISGVIMRKPT